MIDLALFGLILMAAMAVNCPPQIQEPLGRYLDARECSDRYGFSESHWYRLVDAGKAPPPTRFGRLVRWSLSALQDWEAAGCPSCRSKT